MKEKTMIDELVIRTQGLSKSYDGTPALSELSLQVPRHSITGFLGPNGAGKSTTIKLLLGLLRPTAGQGTIFGLDIEAESNAIRRRTGYLAQQPTFYPNLTARETLRFVGRFFYDDAHAIEKLADESLKLVGLEKKADRPVKGFSGGETQRLGIAQAQINRPDLLILDEPAAALDPMGREQVLAIMERLREQSTIFYSTHILDDVQRISDRVAILNQGRLVAQGPIAQLLDGGGRIIYHVALRGDSDRALQRVEHEPWVDEVTVNHNNGYAAWQIAVSDQAQAESKLLRRVLAAEDVDVLSFGRRQIELEEAFMQLVQEQ
jgi:ABC-2 type transport system ATP-binding protein